MPLAFAQPGHTGQIQKINGKDEVRRHLAALGFVVGQEIKVVNRLAGSLIIEIKGTRVALDGTMAARILV